MKLTDLKEKKLSDLKEIAKTMGIEKISSFSKEELMNAMVSAAPAEKKEEASKPEKAIQTKEAPKNLSNHNESNEKRAAGVLEILPEWVWIFKKCK